MIIENGTLQVIARTGGGSVNGNPVKVSESEGTPIPCNLKTITHDHKGQAVDGEFTQASYEVLIDSASCPQFTAERVVLTDNRSRRIGEFRVQDIQHLDCVNAIKITATLCRQDR